MYSVFILTIPLRVPLFVCASVCEMKIIVQLWANYMAFVGLNFSLHGLASVLRSSELFLDALSRNCGCSSK